MSTRANIIITDDNHERLYFYRHSDGYPDKPAGAMATLTMFLDMVKQGKIRDNAQQAAGWLIMLGTEEYEQTLAKCLAQPKNDYMSWKVGAYEPTTCIHGDVEYIYVVNLATKRVEYIDGYDFTTDDVNKLVELSFLQFNNDYVAKAPL